MPPAPIPVTQLGYQSDIRCRVVVFVRLVAWWCIAIGVLVLIEFSMQMAMIYTAGMMSAGFWRARPDFLIGLAIEMIKLCASVGLLVIGINVLRGQMRATRYCWIVLAVVLAIHAVSYAATVFSYWHLSLGPSAPNRFQMLGEALIRNIVSCVPAMILLTIVRQSDVRASIEQLS